MNIIKKAARAAARLFHYSDKFFNSAEQNPRTIETTLLILSAVSFISKIIYVTRVPVPPTDYIAMEEPGVNFINAGGTHIPMPPVEYKKRAVKKYFTVNKVDYIAADRRYMYKWRKNMRFLMNPKEAEKEGYSFVKKFNGAEGNDIIIYSVTY